MIASWSGTFTNGISTIGQDFLSWVKTNLVKAVDGVGGSNGTAYAPATTIEIEGEGISSTNIKASTFTGAQQFNASANFDNVVTTNAALIAAGPVVFGSVISPAALGSTQDDWAPTGHATANVIRVTPDPGGTSLTGLDAGEGTNRVVLLVVVGGGTLTLEDENGNSSAINRFAIPAPRAIAVWEAVTLWYDSTSGRWRVIG
jgi:hypothetical protein